MFSGRTRLLLRCVLVLSLIKAIDSRHQKQLRRVCYFTNWSCDLLVKEAYFCLRDLDASLCSHIIFAFAGINVTSLSLAPTRVDDESGGSVKGRYIKFNDIKTSNPGVKTLLSAGGSYQAEKFKIVTATTTSRRNFAYNTARYVRQWGFDGLDLDWEYPGQMEKEALTHLVKDLRSAFREEAARTGQQELLLSIAVPVGEERVRLGYQVDLISKEADMINLMAYDFYYGAWAITAFNSPLYPRNHHSFSRKHSVEWIVNLWINLGAPPHKINLGVAGYGQSFTLQIDPHEALPPELQTNGNRTGTELDAKNHNEVSKNSSAVNDTFTTLYNDVHNSVQGNRQTLSPINNSVRKNVKLCDEGLDDCVRDTHLFQNISRKRDRRGTLSQNLSGTSTPSDVVMTSTHSNIDGFDSNNTDQINIHTNGIGNQEIGPADIAALGVDRSRLSQGEFTTHRTDNGERRHAGSAPHAGNSNQQRNTETVMYGINSKPQHRTDKVVYGVGSKAVGPGRPGRLRHLKGQLSYPEICERIQGGAEVAWDLEQRVPYAVLGDQWVGYDNTRSVAEKVTWAFDQHLGGVMFWSLDLDDFKGDYCGEGRFPLLTSMSKTVISLASERNESIIGYTRHFTNETPWDEGTDAVTTFRHESRTTTVSHRNVENATKRPLITVAFPSNQNTTHQLVTKSTRLSRQNVHDHRMATNAPSYHNTTDLLSDVGITDIPHFTNRHAINFLTPANVRNVTNITTTKAAKNVVHEANMKDNLTSTDLFHSDERKQVKPTDFFFSNESKQSEPTDLFPSNKSKQSGATDFFPSDRNKQSEPTDLFSLDESKQSEPSDFFTSDGKDESESNSNYYYYNTDSEPTVLTTTTTATTTPRKSKTDKQKKTHRKPGTKKRYLNRNTSSNLTSSISVVVFVICVTFFQRIYS